MAAWNKYLAFVALALIFVDYGLNNSGPALIREGRKSIESIAEVKIINLIIISAFIYVIHYTLKFERLRIEYVLLAIIGYALNPVSYFQAHFKSGIPLIISIVSVFLALMHIENIDSIEGVYELFSARIIIATALLWVYIIYRSISDVGLEQTHQKENLWVTNKGVFLTTIGLGLYNSGYIVAVDGALSNNEFIVFSIGYKITLIGVMITNSYCHTVLNRYTSIKYHATALVLIGVVYAVTLPYVYQILGVDVEITNIARAGFALIYVTQSIFMIMYYKIIIIAPHKMNNMYKLMMGLGVAICMLALNNAITGLVSVTTMPIIASLIMATLAYRMIKYD